MPKVTYNQTGYVGSSMSERATLAYEDGEMPKSKWTKKAMLAAIEACCDENDLAFDGSVAEMKKDEIFSRFFWRSSWHHTGKFARETDFYKVDEDEVCDAFPKLSDDEIEARDAEREAAKKAAREAEMETRRQAREEKARRDALQLETYGFVGGSLVADVLEANPSLFTRRVSKKGNEMLVWHVGSTEHQCLASKAASTRMYTW